MSDLVRPVIAISTTSSAVNNFVSELQSAIDTGNADLFNRSFAQDVAWGSPFGAIADGYDQIHAIHTRMFSSVPATPGAARYEIEKVRQVSSDVVIAFIRRSSTVDAVRTPGTSPGSFDELALIVLVQRDEGWWLAAAQHVPDRRDVYK